MFVYGDDLEDYDDAPHEAVRPSIAPATSACKRAGADGPRGCFAPIEGLMTARACPDAKALEGVARLDKALAGGKSGAYVFLVTLLDGTKGVVKYYPTVVSDANNERPFREVVALCALSGEVGFPCLYDYGCARKPLEWQPALAAAPEVGLYAVMSEAKRETLTDLDISALRH